MPISDDQIQSLVLSLEARTDKLDRSIANFTSTFDQRMGQSERRADQFGSRLEQSFAKSGANAARNLMGALGIGLSLDGIGKLLENVTDVTDNIEKQSKTLGISTDTYQAWVLSAQRASVGQDDLNTAVDTFSRNVGDAQLKQTDFGKVAQQLGVNLKGGVTAAMYQYIDSLMKVENVEQRNSLSKLGFGKSFASIVPFIQQGSQAIKAQAEEFHKNGEIIDKDAIAKINQAKNAYNDLKSELIAQVGATFVSALADDFQKFSAQIRDPKFQQGLHDMAADLGQAAVWVAKIAGSHPDASLGALAGLFAGGVPGAIGGAGLGAIMDHRDSIRLWGLKNVQLPTLQGDLRVAKAGMGGDPKDVQRKLDAVEHEIAQLENKKYVETPGDIVGSNVDSLYAVMNKPTSGKGGGIDLAGALQDSAYAKAVQAIRARIAALQDQTAADNATTYAQEKQRAATEMLNAANADAQKSGHAVTEGQKAQIDQLADSYAKLSAARAFADDLRTEDERIAKLGLEGQKAEQTAATIGRAVSLQNQLDDYHKRFGTNATPSDAQMADINARADRAGVTQGGSAMDASLVEQRKRADDLATQNAALGQFGAAAAQAEMRQTLLVAAQRAGVEVTPELTAQIDTLVQRYGDLTQSSIDLHEKLNDQIQITDEARSGLSDVGVAATTSFKGAEDAAKQFLLRLLQMYVQLQVMQPFMDQLFGQQGTAGGGLLGPSIVSMLGGQASGAHGPDPVLENLNFGGAGAAGSGGWLDQATSWLSDLFSFADGGIMTNRGPMALRRYADGGVANSPQLAMYGEGDGPEAFVPLKNGGIPVRLSMPRAPSASSMRGTNSGGNVIHYQAPPITIVGVTAEEVDRKLQTTLASHEQRMARMVTSAVPAVVTDMAAKRKGPWN